MPPKDQDVDGDLLEDQSLLPTASQSNRTDRRGDDGSSERPCACSRNRGVPNSLLAVAKNLLSTLHIIGHHGIRLAALSISLYTIPIVFAARLASYGLNAFADLLVRRVIPFLHRVGYCDDPVECQLDVQPSLQRSWGSWLGPNAGHDVRQISESKSLRSGGQSYTEHGAKQINPSEDAISNTSPGHSPLQRSLRSGKGKQREEYTPDVYPSTVFPEHHSGLQLKGKEAEPAFESEPQVVRRASQVLADIEKVMPKPLIPRSRCGFLPLTEDAFDQKTKSPSSPSVPNHQQTDRVASPSPEILVTSKFLDPKDQIPLPHVQMSIGLWQKHFSRTGTPTNEKEESDDLPQEVQDLDYTPQARQESVPKGDLEINDSTRMRPEHELETPPNDKIDDPQKHEVGSFLNEEMECKFQHDGDRQPEQEPLYANDSYGSSATLDNDSIVCCERRKTKPLEYWFADKMPEMVPSHGEGEGDQTQPQPQPEPHASTFPPGPDEPSTGRPTLTRSSTAKSLARWGRRASIALLGPRLLGADDLNHPGRRYHSLDSMRDKCMRQDGNEQTSPRIRNVLRKSRRSTELEPDQ